MNAGDHGADDADIRRTKFAGEDVDERSAGDQNVEGKLALRRLHGAGTYLRIDGVRSYVTSHGQQGGKCIAGWVVLHRGKAMSNRGHGVNWRQSTILEYNGVLSHTALIWTVGQSRLVRG